ncbi:MAG TPA: aminoglycoside phosphotransferase family protein [Candidatus Limnocylindrales bacterium]|nr:aminoglycoside phosphotransferase family protein [Candidatus Limnocylindrales bacterium]
MLAEAISHSYGLAVISVTPMPSGYAARCFDVRSPAGRFVAKVWRADPPGEAWVRLCDSLHFLGVPPTLRTLYGERIFSGPLGPMCLQPYVPGATPPDWPWWPPPILRSLGEFLAAVHATPPPPGLPRDDLSLKMSNVDSEFSGVIHGQLTRLQRLRDAIPPARLSPGAMVLCHTDPGGDNILLGPDGRLTLLDWDEAAICFPETDFVLIARDQPPSGEPLRLVRQGYRHDLCLDRLAFLMLRRYVADALARVDRLLDPASTETDRRHARDGIVEWGIRQWDRLDDALQLAAL